MSKTTLLYKDIAPGAALDATVTAPTAQDRSALAQLPGGTVEEPAATGELNQWDGRGLCPGVGDLPSILVGGHERR